MSEQVANAEPAAEVAGGQAVAETPAPAPAPAAAPAAAEPQQLSFDDQLAALWDKNHAPPKPEPPKAEAKAAPESDQKPSTAPEPDQSSPAISAPTSWSPERQAQWGTLPPDVQQYIADRELEASRQISRQGAELKTYEPMRQIYGALNQLGVPQGREAEIVQNWFNAQRIMDQNPLEGLKWLAQSYGVSPAQLAGQPSQPDQQQQPSAVDDLFKDPRVDALNREIAGLKQYISQLGGTVSAREQQEAQRMQAAQEAEKAGIVNAIQKFSAGKPYFAHVEEELAHEARYIKEREPHLSTEQILDKAYDRAVYANPDIRNRVLAEQRKAEADKAQKEAAARQAEAKKMAAMNVRTGASASTPTYDGKWDSKDNLGAMYDRIVSR